MFHVAPWIPKKDAVQTKRHLGNDYCVIVFLDSDEPFSPELIKTKLVHVYVIVQKDAELSRASGTTVYRVACVLREGMPTFGPRLLRIPTYEKGKPFVDFLLTKVVNGEKASKFAPDFIRQRSNLREWWLKKMWEDARNASEKK